MFLPRLLSGLVSEHGHGGVTYTQWNPTAAESKTVTLTLCCVCSPSAERPLLWVVIAPAAQQPV